MGVVGESGCGKTMTALGIMGLLPSNCRVMQGSVKLDGVDVDLDDRQAMRATRGSRVAMVFQDSLAALNPVLKIGVQVTEGMRTHLSLTAAEARAKAVDSLKAVGIPDAETRMGQYPHQLSGGLRQRIATAMALAADPDVLIADEATTALDVSVQAQLLELFRQEQQRRGMALIVITHDLGVVAQTCERVAVMYSGRIVESGDVDDVFYHPRHPYTVALWECVPRIEGPLPERIPSIGGAPPPARAEIAGCAFNERCRSMISRCKSEDPQLTAHRTRTEHLAACWNESSVA